MPSSTIEAWLDTDVDGRTGRNGDRQLIDHFLDTGLTGQRGDDLGPLGLVGHFTAGGDHATIGAEFDTGDTNGGGQGGHVEGCDLGGSLLFGRVLFDLGRRGRRLLSGRGGRFDLGGAGAAPPDEHHDHGDADGDGEQSRQIVGALLRQGDAPTGGGTIGVVVEALVAPFFGLISHRMDPCCVMSSPGFSVRERGSYRCRLAGEP